MKPPVKTSKTTVPKKPPVEDNDTGGAGSVLVLLDRVSFQPENVVAEAAINPDLFVKAIRYRLECLLKKSDAKMKYKRVQAEIELEIRQEARAKDDKITENHIKAQLTLNSEVTAAERLLETSEAYDEYSKLVVEVFRMRRDSLQIVRGMMNSEMSVTRLAAVEAEIMDSKRDELRKRFPGE